MKKVPIEKIEKPKAQYYDLPIWTDRMNDRVEVIEDKLNEIIEYINNEN